MTKKEEEKLLLELHKKGIHCNEIKDDGTIIYYCKVVGNINHLDKIPDEFISEEVKLKFTLQ